MDPCAFNLTIRAGGGVDVCCVYLDVVVQVADEHALEWDGEMSSTPVVREREPQEEDDDVLTSRLAKLRAGK
jgi:hypothetical protein